MGTKRAGEMRQNTRSKMAGHIKHELTANARTDEQDGKDGRGREVVGAFIYLARRDEVSHSSPKN